MVQHCTQYHWQCGSCTLYQLSETAARNFAEIEFDSTSATLHETISRGDILITTIACNISSNVAPRIRAAYKEPTFSKLAGECFLVI